MRALMPNLTVNIETSRALRRKAAISFQGLAPQWPPPKGRPIALCFVKARRGGGGQPPGTHEGAPRGGTGRPSEILVIKVCQHPAPLGAVESSKYVCSSLGAPPPGRQPHAAAAPPPHARARHFEPLRQMPVNNQSAASGSAARAAESRPRSESRGLSYSSSVLSSLGRGGARALVVGQGEGKEATWASAQ